MLAAKFDDGRKRGHAPYLWTQSTTKHVAKRVPPTGRYMNTANTLSTQSTGKPYELCTVDPLFVLRPHLDAPQEAVEVGALGVHVDALEALRVRP